MTSRLPKTASALPFGSLATSGFGLAAVPQFDHYAYQETSE